MKLNEALEKVYSAIDEIKNIDFDQTGEEIERDLLGYHRYYNVDGVVDQVNNCLQELQTIVDQYKRIEDELGIDLVKICRFALYGGYYKNPDTGKIMEIYEDDIRADFCFRQFHCYYDDILTLYFKDYGVTWALTKEELL